MLPFCMTLYDAQSWVIQPMERVVLALAMRADEISSLAKIAHNNIVSIKQLCKHVTFYKVNTSSEAAVWFTSIPFCGPPSKITALVTSPML